MKKNPEKFNPALPPSLYLFFYCILYLQHNISSKNRHIMSRFCMINKFFHNFAISRSCRFEWTIHSDISARKWYHVRSLCYLTLGIIDNTGNLHVYVSKRPHTMYQSWFPLLHFYVLIFMRLFRLGHWTWCISEPSCCITHIPGSIMNMMKTPKLIFTLYSVHGSFRLRQ